MIYFETAQRACMESRTGCQWVAGNVGRQEEPTLACSSLRKFWRQQGSSGAGDLANWPRQPWNGVWGTGIRTDGKGVINVPKRKRCPGGRNLPPATPCSCSWYFGSALQCHPGWLSRTRKFEGKNIRVASNLRSVENIPRRFS